MLISCFSSFVVFFPLLPYSVTNLPTHTPLVAAVIGLLHRTTGIDLSTAVVDHLPHYLTNALQNGDSIAIRLLVRFMVALSSIGVIQGTSIMEQFQLFIQRIKDLHGTTKEVTEAQYLLYTILISFPWFTNTIGSNVQYLGLGNDQLRPSFRKLFHDLTTLMHSSLVPTLDQSTESTVTLVSQHQTTLSSITNWLDASVDTVTRLNIDMSTVASHPVRQLWMILNPIITKAFEDDENEDTIVSWGDLWGNLAVGSIARPQDDTALCEAMGYLGLSMSDTLSSTNDNSNTAATNDPEGDKAGLQPNPKRNRTEISTDTYRSKPRAGPLSLVLIHYTDGKYTVGNGNDSNVSVSSLQPLAVTLPVPPHSAEVSSSTCFVLRPHVTLFGHGGLSNTPATLNRLNLATEGATPLALFVAREVAHDIITLYHPLHLDAAKLLLFTPMGRGRGSLPPFSCVPISVEAVLTQMLWLPNPPEPLQFNYFCSLLLDLFREESANIQSKHARQRTDEPLPVPITVTTLGMACRIIYKYCPVIDPMVIDRLTRWIAHYVNNTGFEWLWDEWKNALDDSVPLYDPQRRFVTDVLQRTFALIGPYHYENIVRNLPEIYRTVGLVPAKVTEAAHSPFFDPTLSKNTSTTTATDKDEDNTNLPESSDMNAEDADILRYTAPGLPPQHSLSSATPGEGTGHKVPTTDPFALGTELMNRQSTAEAKNDLYLDSLHTFAKECMVKLQQKLPNNDMAVWFTEQVQQFSGLHSNHSTTASPRFLRVFTHSLLLYGKANIRNAFILFERYHNLLVNECSIRNDRIRAHIILGAITAVWSKATHVVPAIIEAALDTRIVTPSDVISFALEPADEQSLVDSDDNQSNKSSTTGSSNVHNLNRHPGIAPLVIREHLLSRLSKAHIWDLVHHTLDRAYSSVYNGGTELALFRGMNIYDENTPLITENDAVEKEHELIQAAEKASTNFRNAVQTCLLYGARVTRSLQGYMQDLNTEASISSSKSTHDTHDEQGLFATREILRVTLAHLRAIGRDYCAVFEGNEGKQYITEALEQTSHILVVPVNNSKTTLSSTQRNNHHHDHDHDLLAAVYHALPFYRTPVMNLVPSLQRDRTLPSPGSLVTKDGKFHNVVVSVPLSVPLSTTTSVHRNTRMNTTD